MYRTGVSVSQKLQCQYALMVQYQTYRFEILSSIYGDHICVILPDCKRTSNCNWLRISLITRISSMSYASWKHSSSRVAQNTFTNKPLYECYPTEWKNMFTIELNCRTCTRAIDLISQIGGKYITVSQTVAIQLKISRLAFELIFTEPGCFQIRCCNTLVHAIF